MKRTLGVLLLVVLGFAVPVVAAEAWLRLTGRADFVPVMYVPDEHTVWRLKPGADERSVRAGYFDYRWTTSPQQFRGTREYLPSKKPGLTRILAVGDSFTFGVGVDDTAAYPARLEQLLARQCTHEVEVINGGVGGFGTSHALALLEGPGLALHSDLVALGFMTSDRVDDARSNLYEVRDDSLARLATATERYWGSFRLSELRVYDWLTRRSAFANWLQQRMAEARLALTTPREVDTSGTADRSDETTAPLEQGWWFAERLFDRVRDVTQSADARLLVVVIPFQDELEAQVQGDTLGTAARHRTMRICRELGLECVDFADWFVRRHEGQDFRALYIEGEGHMTPRGYALLAQSVADRILEMNVLACGAAEQQITDLDGDHPRSWVGADSSG